VVARGADDPSDAAVHRSQERVAVRRLYQAAGAGEVEKGLRFVRADPQRRSNTVEPEFGPR
jgi:hypothetical protein